MSPPWATTSSRFCVPCAPTGPASAEGSAAAAPATPAAFNSSRRVRPLMRHLPGECCYLRALGSGCQGRAGATIRATMRTADVVVIGGGVNGASTAFHLTTLGVRDVLLLERRHLAAGATGKSGALVRMHYTNDVESRLALESLKVFRDFGAIVGGECGFEPVGFVQLVGPEYRDALRRNVARQQALGIDTREASLDDVRRLLPGVDLAGVGAAAYEPGSGFADPNATAYAFAEAARRGGATVQTHCEAVRLVVEGGRVAAVETTAGRVATRAVVIAAGAWAQPLLAPLGLDYGLSPFRVQVAIFRWPAGFAQRHPAVIDATRMSWLRPEGAAATLIGVELGAAHADPEKYDEGVDAAYVARCREALTARLPQFADAPWLGGDDHDEPRRPADHRPHARRRGTVGDARRLRYVVQDRARDRPLPRRVDHRRRTEDGRPPPVPRLALRRGRAVDRRRPLRRRGPHRLSLTALGRWRAGST